MSADSEKLYSTREVATELGLGAAMLRRYASTYETVTGDEITVHRRDGRLFTEAQVQVLTAARSLVMTTNVDVETAVRGALDRPLEAASVALAQSSALGSDVLLKALTDAQREANAPLLGELRSIRESLERLERTQLVEPETAAQIEQLDKLEAAARETAQTSKHGPVVHFVLWLERRFRG
jgi:predicted transcriptional regulator